MVHRDCEFRLSHCCPALSKDIENCLIGLQGICPHILDSDPPGDCASDKSKGRSRPIALYRIASGAICLATLDFNLAPSRVGLNHNSERTEYMASHLKIGDACRSFETQAGFALCQGKCKHQSTYVL